MASKAKNLGQLKIFFTFETRKAFTKLRQAFIKAPILNHFNLEYHIRIEMDIFDNRISEIFSLLNLDN